MRAQTRNLSILSRLYSDTEKHLGDFLSLRCSNPRSYLDVYLAYATAPAAAAAVGTLV